MTTKVMKVGVISKENYRKRTIAIAKGEYSPRKSEPKVWFESIKSLSQVLSSENQKLLETIVKLKPRSLTELEELTQRSKPNLSRTLKTLAKYGIVDLPREKGRIVPKVNATDFKVEFGSRYSHPIPTEDSVAASA